MSMTISEFDGLITKVTSAAAENKNPRTALIFLRKALELVEETAYQAMVLSERPDVRTAMAKTGIEAHNHCEQVTGFIQEMVIREIVREKGEKVKTKERSCQDG